MDAVLLALVSAACFGAMPVAVRFALVPPVVPAAVGALLMQVATFAVLCAAAALQGGMTLAGVLPFLVAGAIAPGLSNLFITVGIREAGSSRASVAFGTAPLFAVTIAVLGFGERPGAAVLFGAVLIVCGGVALALEPDRPRHVRRRGDARDEPRRDVVHRRRPSSSGSFAGGGRRALAPARCARRPLLRGAL